MIGLEIHTYLVTEQKLFCECAASREKGLKANVNICAICIGQPGAKPMLPNEKAVGEAVKIGLMLRCKINEKLVWQRKHYSWPDLPKGYQDTISGSKAVSLGEEGKFAGIRIRSMHLEEDPAAWEPETGRVDYNRSGLPLVEIITEPDFTTSEEVGAWLKKLIHNLEYLKCVASDAGIKVDVNVNIPGKTERVEIKNVNSIESIMRAIDFEFERQAKEGNTKKETRRFDAVKGKTVKMREKEGEDDYRFIIDPDLKPIVLDDAFIENLKKEMPESPDEKLEKLIKKYKIEEKDAEVLAKNLDIVEFFEQAAGKIDGKFALHWVIKELAGMLNYNKKKLSEVDIRVEHFVEVLEAVKKGKITEGQGKKMIQEFYPRSFSLKGRKIEGKISDSSQLGEVVQEVLRKEKEAVEKLKKGDDKVINYLIGQVMKETKGRADFKVVSEMIRKLVK